MATDWDRPWHCLNTESVAAELGSDLDRGLPAAEALSRLEAQGPNALRESRERSLLAMLAAQFSDFMIQVLLAAAIIAGLIGEPQDSVAIVAIVLLNGILGFAQDFRAERAMAALKKLASPQARVFRDGTPTVIDASLLVPGDLVELEAGNIVPADLRLIDLAALKVNESALTGESLPVVKSISSLAVADVPLGDRLNLAYRGTTVTYGRGHGLVVATGMRTELGKIASLLSFDVGRTPLQRRLADLGKRLAVAVLAICVVIFVAGWLHGQPPLSMLLTAVSLAVAAIPEALPAVVTITLAQGAARMVRQHALIRRLPAVETLGSVTYICSDKTGTLTLNRMQVETLCADGTTRTGLPLDGHPSPWHELGLAMALCNDAEADAAGTPVGDPTETALFAAARAGGFERAALAAELPRIAEIPFDAERARMSTLHQAAGQVLVLVKGAPETVLPRCVDRLSADTVVPIDVAARYAEVDALAGQGLRVLAFALRRLSGVPAAPTAETVETNLTFLGFAGLIDPPRPEAAEAVAACKAAGIVPVMITGDHPVTARAIAARLGIIEQEGKVLTGSRLAQLSMQEFERESAQVRVYARTNPEQKIKIVQVLKDRGEFVAMTGDGVNDAPALKAADIGVAMGQGGTDVAREAAHMTLLDDNFASILLAVREGRRIFDNIRKFVKYVLTGNAGEIWLLFLAPFLGLPIPLLPIQILWVNLVTDGLTGLAFSVEPEEKGIMQRPPRPPNENLFAHGIWQHIVWAGLLIGGVSIFAQAWALRVGSDHWQSMALTVLTLSQMAHILAVRSERESLFTIGILSNRPMLAAILLTFVLQLAILYVPFLNPVFKTTPLTLGELALCLALSALVFVAVEIEKMLIRHGRLYPHSA